MPSLAEDPDGRIRLLVDHLGKDLEPSILIGGWATYIRVGGEISKDIDLIVTDRSRYLLSSVVENLTDNNVHQGRKYRGEVDGVHLDIYVPHESQLGARLRLKVEVLEKYVDIETAPPWMLLTIDAHFVTKLAALFDRHQSEKGAKDAREVLALLKLGVDPGVALTVLAESGSGTADDIPAYVDELFTLVPKLVRLSKQEQKLVAEWKRSWIQSALDYVRGPEMPERRL